MCLPPVCEDITYLTSSVLDELPLSDISIQPQPDTKESNFEFSTSTANTQYSIKADKGAVLMNLNLEGSFTSYQVFVVDENGAKSAPAQVIHNHLGYLFKAQLLSQNVLTTYG